MYTSQQFRTFLIIWLALCWPVLFALLFIESPITDAVATVFSLTPYVPAIFWKVAAHLAVFLVPFLFALRYLTTTKRLSVFLVVASVAAGLQIFARNIFVSVAHIDCVDRCAPHIIPLQTDQLITYSLAGTFVVIIVATGIRYWVTLRRPRR